MNILYEIYRKENLYVYLRLGPLAIGNMSSWVIKGITLCCVYKRWEELHCLFFGFVLQTKCPG